LVYRRPTRVDDVDQHQRCVVGQVNEDVVRRVVVAVPRQLDPLAPDFQCAVVLERLLWRRSSGVIVTKQELAGLIVLVTASPARLDAGGRRNLLSAGISSNLAGAFH
jgi:hypothetical protein